MTTYAYLRVSTLLQDTEKNKLEILKFANEMKFGNVEFTEEHVTGKKHFSKRLIGQLLNKIQPSLSNTRLQKWRLYCYLGEIHNVIDAVFMGLQMGLLSENDLAEPIKEEILDCKNKKQIYSWT